MYSFCDTQQNFVVPAASTLCFSVYIFPLCLRTCRGRGWTVNYFKMNIINDITSPKIENAVIMLNYNEKMSFALKHSKDRMLLSQCLIIDPEVLSQAYIFSAAWCMHQTILFSNIWLSSLRVSGIYGLVHLMWHSSTCEG